MTLLPARAKRRIRWFLECGWWYHQSSPPKQMIDLSCNIGHDSTIRESEAACGSGRLLSDVSRLLSLELARPLPQAVLTNMQPTIYLALTHDWELRGDGSGDIEQIQFAPLRRLLEIYAKFGARVTILPDLMQQIKFRELEARHPELKPMADSWDDHVREAFRQGHDIQLHLHPQWLRGKHENSSWELNGDWSILNYNEFQVSGMLATGRMYLENLLRPIDSSYRVQAFRAGALVVAPSNHLFKLLAELGIELDVSIAGCVFVNDQHLQLDYRNCEEAFLPFYPVMEDARRVSRNREEIVCVPLNHFYCSCRAVIPPNHW